MVLVVVEPQGSCLHGTPRHSSARQRLRPPRLSGSSWLTWVRGQLGQSQSAQGFGRGSAAWPICHSP